MRTCIGLCSDKQVCIEDDGENSHAEESDFADLLRYFHIFVVEDKNHNHGEHQQSENAKDFVRPVFGGEEDNAGIKSCDSQHDLYFPCGQFCHVLHIFGKHEGNDQCVNVAPTVIHTAEAAENETEDREEAKQGEKNENRFQFFFVLSGKEKNDGQQGNWGKSQFQPESRSKGIGDKGNKRVRNPFRSVEQRSCS